MSVAPQGSRFHRCQRWSRCPRRRVRAGPDAGRPGIGDHGRVTRARHTRTSVVLGLCLYLLGAGITLGATLTANRTDTLGGALATVVVSQPPLWLGLLLARRRPGNPTGAALIALGAAVVCSEAIENWGGTFATSDPWLLSRVAATVAPGVWVFNLAGFFLLCLVFPDGPLPGRGWRALPWLGLAAAVVVDAMVSLAPDNFRRHGGVLPGATPLAVPTPVRSGAAHRRWGELAAGPGLRRRLDRRCATGEAMPRPANSCGG